MLRESREWAEGNAFMVVDLSQQPNGAPKGVVRQAVTGVMPPELAEAKIREAFPTLNGRAPGVAKMAQRLIRTVFLAPLGWLLLAPLFPLKFSPLFCRRYTLTNRRLMIQRGLKPKPVDEVPLKDIDDVRLVEGSHDTFMHSGDLEVLSGGQVKLRLAGVPEPEGFRQSVINAVKAWVPSKATGPFQPASAVK
jgi:hypothetical protein